MNMAKNIAATVFMARQGAEVVGIVKTAPNRAIVLVHDTGYGRNGEAYITWLYTQDAGGGGSLHSGHYDMSLPNALDSLANRSFTAMVW